MVNDSIESQPCTTHDSIESPPCTTANVAIGLKVQRGPTWTGGDDDGGPGGVGVVVGWSDEWGRAKGPMPAGAGGCPTAAVRWHAHPGKAKYYRIRQISHQRDLVLAAGGDPEQEALVARQRELNYAFMKEMLMKEKPEKGRKVLRCCGGNGECAVS